LGVVPVEISAREAGHGAAGDGDEEEGEQAARPYRAGTVDEFGERRHLQVGRNHGDADGGTDDGADLEEGGEVRRRQQRSTEAMKP
jgi:hypothetical protein